MNQADNYFRVLFAERKLAEAFDRARAQGYRPGSHEMCELKLAEQAYRVARQRRVTAVEAAATCAARFSRRAADN